MTPTPRKRNPLFTRTGPFAHGRRWAERRINQRARSRSRPAKNCKTGLIMRLSPPATAPLLSKTMIRASRRKWIDGLFLSGVFLWLAVYSYPYFFHSLSQNYRQIETYNLDSMVMLRAVEDALSQ